MEAASALIDGLGDEEKRWKEERIEFAQKVDRSDTHPHASIYLDNIKCGNIYLLFVWPLLCMHFVTFVMMLLPYYLVLMRLHFTDIYKIMKHLESFAPL